MSPENGYDQLRRSDLWTRKEISNCHNKLKVKPAGNILEYFPDIERIEKLRFEK